MLRVACAAFWAALPVLAQSPADLFSKAPPAVDDALRARITKFYQAHLEGKFRAADQYVAEESKDIFFEADKRRCKKFEIVRINYSPDFTAAKAVVNCDTEMLLPPKGLMSITMPIPSTWKVQQGDWYWFVVPRGKESPFGEFNAGSGEGTASIPKGPSAEDLRKMISVEPESIRISSAGARRFDLDIKNNMPGVVTLAVEPVAAGDLNVTLDRTEIKGNEAGTLTVVHNPDPRKPRQLVRTEEIYVKVMPLNQRLRVRVMFEN